MERHGPFTKLPDHIKRANRGLTPEGVQLFPVHSGKWISYYHMLHAVDWSIQLWKKENIYKKKIYYYQFDKIIGTVVKRNSITVYNTSKAIVVVSKKGEIITAYPVLEEEIEDSLTVYLKSRTFQEYNELYFTGSG